MSAGSALSSWGCAGYSWQEEETRGALPPGTMLLILGLLVLVPCLALLTSFLLSPGGKSGGNKKNDGVKVSPLLPAPPLPCRRRGPRGTVRFGGRLLAQLSPCVPGPPACPRASGAAWRLCSAAREGAGAAASSRERRGERLQAVASGWWQPSGGHISPVPARSCCRGWRGWAGLSPSSVLSPGGAHGCV